MPMQRDSADQLSRTTDFVLPYFQKISMYWQNECFVKLSFNKGHTEGGEAYSGMLISFLIE